MFWSAHCVFVCREVITGMKQSIWSELIPFIGTAYLVNIQIEGWIGSDAVATLASNLCELFVSESFRSSICHHSDIRFILNHFSFAFGNTWMKEKDWCRVAPSLNVNELARTKSRGRKPQTRIHLKMDYCIVFILNIIWINSIGCVCCWFCCVFVSARAWFLFACLVLINDTN